MKITIQKQNPLDNSRLTFSDITDTPGIYMPYGLPDTRVMIFNNISGGKCFHLYLNNINENKLEILDDRVWEFTLFLRVNEKFVITFNNEES